MAVLTSRRRLAFGIAAGAVLLLVGAATPWLRGRSGHAAPADPAVAVRTVQVARADLSTSHTLRGSLGYGLDRPVKGSREGVVTWLPGPGAVIKRGKPLYRVDDEAVSLFFGSPPLYRTLAARNTVGRDVAMVAANLSALGYSIGKQPRAGTTVTPEAPPPAADQGGGATSAPATPSRVTVRKGDGVLTADLIQAVKRFQRDNGLPADGRLAVGDVVVLSGPVRVETLSAQVGDAAAGQLMSVTPTTKVVTVQAAVTEVGGLKTGDAVTIRLPDGTETPGRIGSIGLVASQGGGDPAGPGGGPSVAVTVTLDDHKAVSRLDGADVEVDVAGETRTGVLAVPVNALLALREGGYAVQLPDGGLVAVKTGLFARGMVEVTGTGLSEGLEVVTAS
ncbi:peptidoglycan-binding protein [Rhizomonospora bruguierae]|uniref:peptidoglycan-binding protein n=1 Tax=Rhizomonospora bruguierae TaxID=1581705 RepID=UPI001BCC7798|nr:peptidoglycan-binding protein [Micromonospora sp. NBRC 107566]